MTKTPFGKTGLSVSPLGFGDAPIGFLQSDQANAARILNQLLDAGVNVIDTAAMYAGSEELIGQAIGHRRSEFVLVSKCGQKFPDIPGEAWSPETIRLTVERALKRLRTDRLDVMLLHTCGRDVLEKGEALAALVAAKKAGKIRFAGYSGDNDAAVYAAGLPDVSAIETSISIADQANIDALLPLTRKNGIGVIAKRPIANAAWKAASEQAGIYAGYADPYHQRLRQMGLTPSELGFSGDAAIAWPGIALRFTLSQPGVHAAIVGTHNAERILANVANAQKGPLPAATIQKIRATFNAAQKAAGQPWPALG